METKSITIALYEDTKHGFTHVSDFSLEQYQSPTMVRISDPIEVSFSMRDRAEIKSDQIKTLDAELDALLSKVAEITSKKAELLSLELLP